MIDFNKVKIGMKLKENGISKVYTVNHKSTNPFIKTVTVSHMKEKSRPLTVNNLKKWTAVYNSSVGVGQGLGTKVEPLNPYTLSRLPSSEAPSPGSLSTTSTTSGTTQTQTTPIKTATTSVQTTGNLSPNKINVAMPGVTISKTNSNLRLFVVNKNSISNHLKNKYKNSPFVKAVKSSTNTNIVVRENALKPNIVSTYNTNEKAKVMLMRPKRFFENKEAQAQAEKITAEGIQGAKNNNLRRRAAAEAAAKARSIERKRQATESANRYYKKEYNNTPPPPPTPTSTTTGSQTTPTTLNNSITSCIEDIRKQLTGNTIQPRLKAELKSHLETLLTTTNVVSRPSPRQA